MKFRWGKKEKGKRSCSKLQVIITQADLVHRKSQIKINARHKEREKEREKGS
jgi:hypothetical protein